MIKLKVIDCQDITILQNMHGDYKQAIKKVSTRKQESQLEKNEFKVVERKQNVAFKREKVFLA